MSTIQGKQPGLFDAIADAGSRGELTAAEGPLWQRFGAVCAPLILDSTGFTRISREQGVIHYLHLFLRMRSIVSPIFEKHECLAWRTVADNLFAEFASPDAALDAALEAHLAVHEAKLMLNEEEPFQVCIGIGYGPLLSGGDDGVFGDEMNLAAKLGEDIAEPGETLLTQAAYEAVQHGRSTAFERREVSTSGNQIVFYSVRR